MNFTSPQAHGSIYTWQLGFMWELAISSFYRVILIWEQKLLPKFTLRFCILSPILRINLLPCNDTLLIHALIMETKQNNTPIFGTIVLLAPNPIPWAILESLVSNNTNWISCKILPSVNAILGPHSLNAFVVDLNMKMFHNFDPSGTKVQLDIFVGFR